MLELRWNTLHNQTKEEILSNACINERFQHYEFMEMEEWERLILVDSMEKRSHHTVTLVS